MNIEKYIYDTALEIASDAESLIANSEATAERKLKNIIYCAEIIKDAQSGWIGGCWIVCVEGYENHKGITVGSIRTFSSNIKAKDGVRQIQFQGAGEVGYSPRVCWKPIKVEDMTREQLMWLVENEIR